MNLTVGQTSCQAIEIRLEYFHTLVLIFDILLLQKLVDVVAFFVEGLLAKVTCSPSYLGASCGGFVAIDITAASAGYLPSD